MRVKCSVLPIFQLRQIKVIPRRRHKKIEDVCIAVDIHDVGACIYKAATIADDGKYSYPISYESHRVYSGNDY